MSLFGGCGNSCGSVFNGNDTILWFIILFLLIFSNTGCCGNVAGDNCDCGC